MHMFKDKLKKLKSRGLLRKIRDRASSQGREIVMGGMRLAGSFSAIQFGTAG